MLIEKRNSLQPNIKSELDNEGVSVNYSELVKMTTTSLINVIETTECNENINQLMEEIQLDPKQFGRVLQ